MGKQAVAKLVEPPPVQGQDAFSPSGTRVAGGTPGRGKDVFFKLLVAGALAVLLGLWVADRLASWSQRDFLLQYLDNYVTLFLLLLSLALGLGLTTWRLWLVATHRPAVPLADGQAPTVTVIVPAYNEGRLVMDTLLSVAASDYPAKKMQIIAVDDGSTDDTHQWMEEAAQRLGKRLELIRQPVNGGKRLALLAGFRRSRGDILVTIDSDSLVDPGTLRHLVAPLAADPRVGAVAGNVRVLNKDEGLLAKILEVCFTYSFDFIRVAESGLDAVVCTPGALSAYRRRAVLPVLEQWINQHFLGVVARIGEDRSLTNLVLRQGYITRLAQEAVVYTKVPTGYRPLSRMLLRWARSNLRETVVMAGFIFGDFRQGRRLGPRINFLLSVYGMTVGELLKVVGLYYLVMDPFNVGLKMLVGCAVASLLPLVVYAARHRSTDGLYAYPYVLLWVFGLSWVSLYALVTPRRSAWLTRGLNGADTRSGSVVGAAPPRLVVAKGGVGALAGGNPLQP